MMDVASVDSAVVAKKLPKEREHLDALERMRALSPYYRWTRSLFAPWLGRRILDAGCGVGNFVEQVADDAELVLAVDLSPMNIDVLNRRFAHKNNVEVWQVDLDEQAAAVAAKNIDTIVCLDVLEHVERDEVLLERFHQIVRPGGHLLVKVPACPWLYGSVDIASEHYRRYTPSELRRKAESAGWEVLKVKYMNVFGVLPYWLKSRVLKKPSTFSRTFKPWQLKAMRAVMPIMQTLDGLVGPPVGQSAILVARKRG